MRQFTKHVRGWRSLPITACVLVFLFAFHAKTAVYSHGFGANPDTATSSKLWVKNQKIPKPPAPPSFITHSQSFDLSNLIARRVLPMVQLASGFVPVGCFSGLSPPLTI